ncbi:class I SAM-dependent methyltransferase [Nonomuraea sp. NPDC046570]|uniref:class I SAM-dependent methyltransferase n=1 Tax=Nonomuraea sp. NPDC046570 TaxID=3155255 RepID=UPI0033F3D866
MTVTPELMAYYERGGEATRLKEGRGRLEFWRTQDILRRILPPAPARVLDAGGGAGVHAEWLAADGHDVELLDPVPRHVTEAARLDGVTARVGDARALPYRDGTFDAVLMLGPLYHLESRDDRVRALTEARRVARPGGLVAAAVITRYSAVHDVVYQGLDGSEAMEAARAAVETGSMTSTRSGFTAHFHEPDEILGEFADAGLAVRRRYGIEGAFWLYGDVNERLDDPERRARLLDAARRLESEPSLLGVSGHLLAVAAV